MLMTGQEGPGSFGAIRDLDCADVHTCDKTALNQTHGTSGTGHDGDLRFGPMSAPRGDIVPVLQDVCHRGKLGKGHAGSLTVSSSCMGIYNDPKIRHLIFKNS